jgi:prephenate dehydrogenase
MDPEEHDRALGVTSHLPHLVAAALAGVLPPELHSLAATGFRDTTRVASGDAALWTGILAQNRAAVLDALAQLQDHLQQFRGALMTDNWTALNDLLARAKKVRDALGN